MPQIPKKKTLFTMLKIARGQRLRGSTGGPILLFDTHYTPQGSKLCDRNTPGGCKWCQEKTSRVRSLALVPIRDDENRTKLFIASGTCLNGFDTTEELENKNLEIERAKKTNLLRVEVIGPSNPFIAPTASWAATFFGAEINDVEAHRCDH